jgi:hypothetical protein
VVPKRIITKTVIPEKRDAGMERQTINIDMVIGTVIRTKARIFV